MDKGKCYSKCNRGQRNKSDFYQTPYSMTQALLEREDFDQYKTILEPACGEGAILEAIERYYSPFGCSLQYFDINKGKRIDFLKFNSKVYYIITNPPYSLANEFILHAMKVCTDKFAFLLPLNYLQGQKRYDSNIWHNDEYGFSLQTVYIFTRMPMLKDTIRNDGKFETGMQAYAWFVWQKNLIYGQYATIEWIDCKDMVVRKK